ncbi:hypothetical protein DSUL_20541 [Desulfovibrionales bacterium]
MERIVAWICRKLAGRDKLGGKEVDRPVYSDYERDLFFVEATHILESNSSCHRLFSEVLLESV